MSGPSGSDEARIAVLLQRAECLLLAETVTEEARALADSCRETAKELRLAAVFAKGVTHREQQVDGERAKVGRGGVRKGSRKHAQRVDEDVDA